MIAISTGIGNNYYGTPHGGVFKELAEQVILWNASLGTQNVCNMIHINDKFYIHYYLNQLNRPNFSYLSYDLSGSKEIYASLDSLSTSPSTYLTLGWSSRVKPEEGYVPLIKIYPRLLIAYDFPNSRIELRSSD